MFFGCVEFSQSSTAHLESIQKVVLPLDTSRALNPHLNCLCPIKMKVDEIESDRIVTSSEHKNWIIQ
jgi:hypothetical protein